MPEIYPVGLVHGTYIICQNEKGMYIVDQHAAKERCNYEKFNEKVAIMMSCKNAIKANTNITLDEMESLINDLRKCKNPYNCPHGRPTVIFYSNYEIEKLFKRSGFDEIK